VSALLIVLILVAVLVVVGTVGFVVRSRSSRVPLPPPAPAPVQRVEPAPAPVQRVEPAPAPEQRVEPGGAPVGAGEAPEGVVVEAVPSATVVAGPGVGDAAALAVVEEIVRPRFRDRLGKARSLLGGYFGSVLGRTSIDQSSWDDLEEALIRADVGIGTTTALLAELKARVKTEGITTGDLLLEALKADLKKRLVSADRSLRFEPGRPNVWLFVGVNGVGKTTTIGKIGRKQVADGRTVIMAAGDTFRAAAAEQLGLWAERTGAQLVRGAEGGDPGSVIFDAVERAAARNIDLVLGDTAGRLQTKTNLMEELRKIRRIASKEPGIVTEVLLVLDATTGQNGLVQAKQFSDVAELTGVVLTKLDGTAKGGIALAIQTELGIPIKLVGLGEGADDLIAFDPDEYVEALFD
jgi:fused signal recognition particle receptor